MAKRKRSSGRRGPRRSVRRRSTRGRVSRRRYGGRRKLRTTVTRVRGRTLGDALTVKLSYSEGWTNVGPALFSPIVRQFRGDSVYDPDFNFAPAPSALGFGVYTQMYNRWTVLGSSIKVTFINETGTGTISARPRTVALVPGKYTEADLGLQGYNGIRGLPYSKVASLTALPGSRSMTTLKGYMTTSKILGLNKMTPLVNDAYTGTGTTDPPVIWFWNIIFEKPVGDTNAMYVDYQTDMTFYVKFWDKKVING